MGAISPAPPTVNLASPGPIGGTTPAAGTFTRVVGTGTTVEHTFILTTGSGINSGGNVVSVQHLNSTLYSAVRALDHLGNEKGAWGVGNASADARFAGYVYNEASNPVAQGSSKGYVIVQSTTYGGALGYDIRPRAGFVEDGSFRIAERANNVALDAAYLLFYVDHTDPFIALGSGSDGHGKNYAKVQSADGSCYVTLRYNQQQGACQYGNGGGTAGDGLGHEFMTAGQRRLLISNDQVLVAAPLSLVPGLIGVNNSFVCDGTHAYYVDGSGTSHQLD